MRAQPVECVGRLCGNAPPVFRTPSSSDAVLLILKNREMVCGPSQRGIHMSSRTKSGGS